MQFAFTLPFLQVNVTLPVNLTLAITVCHQLPARHAAIQSPQVSLKESGVTEQQLYLVAVNQYLHLENVRQRSI